MKGKKIKSSNFWPYIVTLVLSGFIFYTSISTLSVNYSLFSSSEIVAATVVDLRVYKVPTVSYIFDYEGQSYYTWQPVDTKNNFVYIPWDIYSSLSIGDEIEVSFDKTNPRINYPKVNYTNTGDVFYFAATNLVSIVFVVFGFFGFLIGGFLIFGHIYINYFMK